MRARTHAPESPAPAQSNAHTLHPLLKQVVFKRKENRRNSVLQVSWSRVVVVVVHLCARGMGVGERGGQNVCIIGFPKHCSTYSGKELSFKYNVVIETVVSNHSH